VTAARRWAGRLKYRAPTSPVPARTVTSPRSTGFGSSRGPSAGRPSKVCAEETSSATISTGAEIVSGSMGSTQYSIRPAREPEFALRRPYYPSVSLVNRVR
jgi:hypothetical protein